MNVGRRIGLTALAVVLVWLAFIAAMGVTIYSRFRSGS